MNPDVNKDEKPQPRDPSMYEKAMAFFQQEKAEKVHEDPQGDLSRSMQGISGTGSDSVATSPAPTEPKSASPVVPGFKITSAEFSTWNDNTPFSKLGKQGAGGSFTGDDSGKTYSINGKVGMKYDNSAYQLEIDSTHYNHGEKIPRNKEGEVMFDRIDSSNAKYISHFRAGVTKQIGEILSASGSSYVRVNAGVGVQAIGNFGTKGPQDAVHNALHFYENHAKFEGVSGVTPDARISVEVKRYVLGDSKTGLYGKADASLTVPLSQKYGMVQADASVGVGVNVGGASVELSHHRAYEKGATASGVIQGALGGGGSQAYNAMDVRVPVPFAKNMSVFAQITKPVGNRPGMSGQPKEPTIKIGGIWRF